MVLNYNMASAKHYQGSLVVTDFLEQYHKLFKNLKTAFSDNRSGFRCYSSTSFHVTSMKDFVINSGALRCVESLAEYEKLSAIGDFAACSAMEDSILTELNYFKEFWISMLS